MSYENILQKLQNDEVVLLDGGTGTELQKRGLNMVPGAWCGPVSLKNADVLEKVHLDYIGAGADIITAHPEAGPHFHRTVQAIKATGAKAGAALNPSTPVEVIDYVLDELDLILVMSVNPGFGGQSFITSQLKKIEALKARIDQRGLSTMIEVDGGVNPQTARDCLDAGASALVAGSAVFKGGPDAYRDNISALRR